MQLSWLKPPWLGRLCRKRGTSQQKWGRPADTQQRPASRGFSDVALCYPGTFLDNSYLNVLFLKVDWRLPWAEEGRAHTPAGSKDTGREHPGTH